MMTGSEEVFVEAKRFLQTMGAEVAIPVETTRNADAKQRAAADGGTSPRRRKTHASNPTRTMDAEAMTRGEARW